MILLSAAESRHLDRLSVENYGIESYALMRRAGETVADLTLRRWPGVMGAGAMVVAGKGNNGGDGLVAARKLMQAGARVRVALLARAGDLRGDAARACADFIAAGGAVTEIADADGMAEFFDRRIGDRPAVVIDAIFGTGLNAPVRGLARGVIEAVTATQAPVVAVDIASGVNADSGAVMDAAITARLTVTFGYAKYGHASYPGAAHTGELVIAEIGFAPPAIDDIAPRGRLIEFADAAALVTPRATASHKGTYGHLLIIAGSRGKGGAAILASRGALRTGAGLVTAVIPEAAAAVVAAGQPELMTEAMPAHDGHFATNAAAIERLDLLVAGKSALVVGPGIGVNEDTHEIIHWLVHGGVLLNRPAVIDADALNLVAAIGPGMLRTARGPIVLTPHPGEMARLLRIDTEAVNANRIDAARRLVDLTGAGVLLKGARTVIATPDGAIAINSSGNPGMATPGMGDVLSGIVGALLGQGLAARSALILGAFMHGHAADRIAARNGPVGYLAGELADEIPAAIRALLGQGVSISPVAGAK
ncbi:MAG: NAD(P)H-hydrate dehydratase [Candidatus Binataceae bacterium]|nr:NAD(P)H-hydrate dehydratase [Candidatus Binataceae bacterium]